MQILKRVLLSCPNFVRIPQLDVGYPHGPYYSGVADLLDFGAPYCGLGFSDGERPLALEELGITRYPWGQEPKGNFALAGIYCIGYPEEGTELDYWTETFDWSQLLKLTDIHSDLVLKIAPKLTHLKEVVFEHQGTELTPTFLNEIRRRWSF